MKTLIPIALLLLLLIALDSPKIKKQRELLTSGYWTCSQNVYDKDKNKIGTAESLVRYLPSGRSRPPHHSLDTIKVSHNSGLKFTMIMNSTWDLASSKKSTTLSETVKTFQLKNVFPPNMNMSAWGGAAGTMKLKETLLLSLREEPTSTYEIIDLTDEKLVVSQLDDEVICNHPSSIELNNKWFIVEL